MPNHATGVQAKLPAMNSRRLTAAVIGSARITDEQRALAEALGASLVDAGFRVLTGGLTGVMDAALRGARRSPRYREGDTVAILPTYQQDDASDAADIVICTGMNHARNVLVVASASVVLAIGGRAGTLSELALAWEMGRPIIAVGPTEGWADSLAGSTIDDRFSTRVHGPLDPPTAARLAAELAPHTEAPRSFGVR
jgi:uncharacterized protein (TIGR00725 family)